MLELLTKIAVILLVNMVLYFAVGAIVLDYEEQEQRKKDKKKREH